MDITDFLIGYLALGVASLACVLFTSRKDRQIERRVREWRIGLGVDEKPKSAIPGLAVNLLTGLAIIVAWPAALVFARRILAARRSEIAQIAQMMPDPDMTEEEIYAEFMAEERKKLPTNKIRITRADIGQETSIEEVEGQWSVMDAAGGLESAKPFGLRNNSWVKFVDLLAAHQPATLWTFEIRNSDVWELRYRILRGVVMEQRGVLGEYYLIDMDWSK